MRGLQSFPGRNKIDDIGRRQRIGNTSWAAYCVEPLRGPVTFLPGIECLRAGRSLVCRAGQVSVNDLFRLSVMAGGATSARDARPVRDLEAAVRAVGERALGVGGLRVSVHGRAPVEQHWVADVRRDVFSASKTVTSMAVGIARADGLLELGDSVLAHLEHLKLAPSAGVEQITIQHLLTMSSGITYRWDDAHSGRPDDPVRDILSAPIGAAPGSSFAYRGANSYLLSRVIHARSGQDMRDYLVPRLFTPLGITNPHWLRCPRGYSLGAVGLHLRTEELARLTQLLLDHGHWDDRPVVPADYVDSMTADTVPTDGHIATGASAPHPDNARYGRHVWMCARDGAWRMDGIYGQFGIVLPNHRACVTVTAHYEGPTTDILEAIWSEIVPALG